jgi:hypothetical protein
VADNTTLVTPAGSSNSDVIRDIDRGGLGVKTQVVQLDMGGSGATETLVVAGQKTMAASVPVVVASDQSAVPVSGTVTTTPPSHASTNVDQIGGAAITEGQKAMAASVPVVIASDQSAVTVAQATAANLNATVTGTVTTTPPSHASTNVDQVGGAAVTLGAKTSANSIPVVLASDEAALPVTGTFWQATQPVSGTVTANQGGAPWSDNLTQVGGAAVSLGIKTSANSIPVVLASDEATLPVSAASLPLPAGAATSALQTTINTTLGTPAQETGNLATIASLLGYMQRIVELQVQTLAVLQAIRLQAAGTETYVTSNTGAVEPQDVMADTLN